MADDEKIEDKEYDEYLRLKEKYKYREEREQRDEYDRHSRLFTGLYQGITCLLNEHAEELLEEAIYLVNQGYYTPDIIQHFSMKYHLSEILCYYLNNEAVTIVKMKSLTADEVQAVVQAYHEVVVKEAMRNSSRQ